MLRPVEDEGTQLPASRKAAIAALVGAAGQMTVQALADRLGVSVDTIRRDLDHLDREGLVMRTRGGAVDPARMPRLDPGVASRVQVQAAAKERIAAVAASLVTDGDVLIVNAGTTSLAVARALKDHRSLTIATNNLGLAAELSPSCVRDLYLFGGQVRLGAQGTIGPVSFPTAADGTEIDIRCDLALVTVGGVDVDGGFSTSNLAEATMMRQMLARAQRVAILADSSKFGRSLFARVTPLSGADVLVTDEAPPAGLGAELAAAGVQVLTEPVATPET